MLTLKVRRVGNSLGLVLPREAVTQLKVEEGTTLYLVEAPDGSYRLTPFDPEFERQMEAAEEGMARYRNALRTLAK